MSNWFELVGNFLCKNFQPIFGNQPNPESRFDDFLKQLCSKAGFGVENFLVEIPIVMIIEIVRDCSDVDREILIDCLESMHEESLKKVVSRRSLLKDKSNAILPLFSLFAGGD